VFERHAEREEGSVRIIQNSAECFDCGDQIVSKHRHDFVRCSCGNLAVDGGTGYLKRNFVNGNWADTSIVEEDET
jgi:hypothetical protein